ncbi:hypothetical protein C8F04DRAFT_1289152 [Mycena alexandri]|uniref:Uncharacterized protein n=1 Tax=Mycena alexandri TaxID=1745969 RepID=A0AAD6SJ37_9AGAR|nr:hypothetical protein C8F04DRAFT_1300724 [Mycena alexandri]KAJ7028969.1 hypothetical protein C8F04DRAFT_1289152 [Mycena alexandri]
MTPPALLPRGVFQAYALAIAMTPKLLSHRSRRLDTRAYVGSHITASKITSLELRTLPPRLLGTRAPSSFVPLARLPAPVRTLHSFTLSTAHLPHLTRRQIDFPRFELLCLLVLRAGLRSHPQRWQVYVPLTGYTALRSHPWGQISMFHAHSPTCAPPRGSNAGHVGASPLHVLDAVLTPSLFIRPSPLSLARTNVAGRYGRPGASSSCQLSTPHTKCHGGLSGYPKHVFSLPSDLKRDWSGYTSSLLPFASYES